MSRSYWICFDKIFRNSSGKTTGDVWWLLVRRQWDYNTICANIPGWKTFWQKFFRLRAQVQKRKRERERKRERTRKDVENNDNSRSFAYYRSSPIPTLWAEEHISTIIVKDSIHIHTHTSERTLTRKLKGKNLVSVILTFSLFLIDFSH